MSIIILVNASCNAFYESPVRTFLELIIIIIIVIIIIIIITLIRLRYFKRFSCFWFGGKKIPGKSAKKRERETLRESRIPMFPANLDKSCFRDRSNKTDIGFFTIQFNAWEELDL
jgi:hypothetical protein